MTRTRSIFLALFAVIVAAVCIRLGLWQLERLDERRAENARVATGLEGAPVAIDAIGTDSTRSRAQRVDVRGTYDFDHELALINRSRDGAPGVNILTPLRIAGRDTAVLVNRGWVYSPDGATIDLALWREPGDAAGTAYVSWLYDAGADSDSDVAADFRAANASTTDGAGVPPADDSASSAGAGDAPRRVQRLDRTAIARLMPYPIAPYQLVLIDESLLGGARGVGYGSEAPSPFGTAVRDSTRPVRIPLPALDEGPHKSYAVQWFAFAAIALIGTGAVLWKEWPR